MRSVSDTSSKSPSRGTSANRGKQPFLAHVFGDFVSDKGVTGDARMAIADDIRIGAALLPIAREGS
ncbi:MAG TPA: hypothetical protein VE527_05180, partial [Reyranella sp.]|nr:hypothetical protein [Reyranella sp.]